MLDVNKFIKQAKDLAPEPTEDEIWGNCIEKSAAQKDRYAVDDDEYEEYDAIGVDGLLAASEKLLAVSRGAEKEDERDSLYNDRVYTAPKLIAERIKLDHGKVLRTAMGRFNATRSLKGFSPDLFGKYTVGYLNGNPLAAPLEEINPLQLVEQQTRITKMGPGGIGDPNAITESMQNVHASQFGFVDPIAGPESERAGVDVRLASGARIGSDGRIYRKMLNRRNGKREWVSPTDTHQKVVKIPD